MDTELWKQGEYRKRDRKGRTVAVAEKQAAVEGRGRRSGLGTAGDCLVGGANDAGGGRVSGGHGDGERSGSSAGGAAAGVGGLLVVPATQAIEGQAATPTNLWEGKERASEEEGEELVLA